MSSFLAGLLTLGLVAVPAVLGQGSLTVSGTTLAPSFSRQSGVASPRCTNEYRYPIGSGTACCKFKYKRNYPYINAACDGTEVGFDDPRECCVGKDDIGCHTLGEGVCLQKRKIPAPEGGNAISEAPLDASFTVVNAFTDAGCDNGDPNYFMMAGSATGIAFTLDFGDLQSVTGIKLRNSNNNGANNAGLNAYKIEMSDDNVVWTEVLSSTLPDPSTLGCNVPLVTETLQETGRYLRLVADSSHSVYVALQFFEVQF